MATYNPTVSDIVRPIRTIVGDGGTGSISNINGLVIPPATRVYLPIGFLRGSPPPQPLTSWTIATDTNQPNTVIRYDGPGNIYITFIDLYFKDQATVGNNITFTLEAVAGVGINRVVPQMGDFETSVPISFTYRPRGETIYGGRKTEFEIPLFVTDFAFAISHSDVVNRIIDIQLFEAVIHALSRT